jgi:hypothetical protein
VLSFRRRLRVQIQLQDILALVVGYGMAALIFRAFWPPSQPPVAVAVPVLGFYFWLGLAMSGPIILFRRGPRRFRAGESSIPGVPIGSRTWAELAWLIIGIYWIALGLIVIPARLQEFKLRDTVLFGLVPVTVALGFRLFGPRRSAEPGGAIGWTHRAAVALLCTWPIAWICLIALATALR